jgi:hypothetical protein
MDDGGELAARIGLLEPRLAVTPRRIATASRATDELVRPDG